MCHNTHAIYIFYNIIGINCSIMYEDPLYGDDYIFPARLLPKARFLFVLI